MENLKLPGLTNLSGFFPVQRKLLRIVEVFFEMLFDFALDVQFITKYIQPLLPKGYNATNGFIASVVEECCEKILFDIKQVFTNVYFIYSAT